MNNTEYTNSHLKSSLKEYQVLLPNLKFDNNNVYFSLKYPIKINIQKKINHMKDFLINNVEMYDNIVYNNNLINYDIINENFDKGLKVKILYDDTDTFLYKRDIYKIAKMIEFKIVGINWIISNNENDNNNKSTYNDDLYSLSDKNSFIENEDDNASYGEEDYEDEDEDYDN